MPIALEKRFPDERREFVGYVFPGETCKFYTEDIIGQHKEAVAVECEPDDKGGAVFILPSPDVDDTKHDVDSACIPENEIGRLCLSLKEIDPKGILVMNDDVEGDFWLVLTHHYSMGVN